MSEAITLEVLTANAKERSDLSDTSFISDANWYMLINRGRRELYDLLLTAGPDYFETTTTGSTVVDQEDYALPAATASIGRFYKALAVEIQDATGNWVSMKPYRHGDRNLLRNSSDLLSTVYSEYYYRIVGDNLRILPAPTAVRTYRLRYIPFPLDLVASPSTPNTLEGMESYHSDYIELCAALWARIKAEKDVTEWRKERTHMREAILKSAGGRDNNHPRVLGGGRMSRALIGRRWR